MYIFNAGRKKKRGKSNRFKAAAKAKNRRRVNGMHSRKLGRRLGKAAR